MSGHREFVLSAEATTPSPPRDSYDSVGPIKEFEHHN